MCLLASRLLCLQLFLYPLANANWGVCVSAAQENWWFFVPFSTWLLLCRCGGRGALIPFWRSARKLYWRRRHSTFRNWKDKQSRGKKEGRKERRNPYWGWTVLKHHWPCPLSKYLATKPPNRRFPISAVVQCFAREEDGRGREGGDEDGMSICVLNLSIIVWKRKEGE